jgi:hypothetical protein
MHPSFGEAAQHAQFLKRERERFAARFPQSITPTSTFPSFTWNQLERQLTDLAAESNLANFAQTLLNLRAAHADRLPAELLLREVLVLAAIVQEERVPISKDPALAEMGEDSFMP